MHGYYDQHDLLSGPTLNELGLRLNRLQKCHRMSTCQNRFKLLKRFGIWKVARLSV